MSDPDLEGFVRMEGVKGKRYLAIKGDLLAYYNTYNVSFTVNRLNRDYLTEFCVRSSPKTDISDQA